MIGALFLGRLLRLLLLLVGAAVIVLILLRAGGLVRAWSIPASSMEPTLHCDSGKGTFGCRGTSADRIVSLRYVFGDPKRGDIVVFHTPPAAVARCGAGGVFVKRIVGLPGERWAERHGRVFIDGKPLREPYVPAVERDVRTIAARRIPAGHYVVLGDNRNASCDSREWGPVRRSAIIGKALIRYWPLSRVGTP